VAPSCNHTPIQPAGSKQNGALKGSGIWNQPVHAGGDGSTVNDADVESAGPVPHA